MVTYKRNRRNALHIIKRVVQAILGLIAATLFWVGLFSIPSYDEILRMMGY